MLNHEDNNEEIKKMVLFCIAAVSCVVLVFLLLLVKLKGNNTEAKKVNVDKDAALENTDDIVLGKNKLVSDDLDFWDMYSEPKKPIEDEEDDKPAKSNKKPALPSNSSSRDEIKDDAVEEPPEKDDDLDDDEHLKVIGENGNPEFYKIIDDFPKHDYNFDRFLQLDNNKLKYTDRSLYVKKGIDISKYQGTIDFTKIKNNNIDFIMVKVAGRGYETGNITIDDKFVEYIQGALSVGLPVGVYFCSQAVNDVEAVEEANYAVAASLNYSVTYPVAIYLEDKKSENARTDRLDNKDRTLIVKKFCDTVKTYGRIPIICASRDYLIAKLDLEELRSYDIWIRDDVGLAENLTLDSVTRDNGDSSSSSSSSSSSRTSDDNFVTDIKEGLKGPDFPYRFSMWQYTENGGAMGINGKVNVDFCFENFLER